MLREAWREGKRVRKRTIANLTDHMTLEQALALREFLKGQKLVPAESAFEVTGSKLHGHVLAVLIAMRQLGFEQLLASRPSRERTLVMAMVAFRVLEAGSKLAVSRAWHDTSLPGELGVADANEDDLYRAMDWLASARSRIERKLAKRHLGEGSHALFDLTSSSVDGEHCELAAFGYNRDKKRGKKQINWGLLTDTAGRPVAISVFPGNTSDPKTLLPQVEKLRSDFRLESFTLVGDRGMISKAHINEFTGKPGVTWITALRSASIRPLIASGVIQASLFEETNLFEFTHPDYPGERLVACRNPVLGRKRAHSRSSLLAATQVELDKIKSSIEKGTMKAEQKIALKVGGVLGKFRMAKHIKVTISEAHFDYELDQDSIDTEAQLDGIYIIRTNLQSDTLAAGEVVLAYKNLSEVERSFRTMKSPDLQVRPIHHRLPDRVTAHLFICALAYYVRWHMQQAWSSLTFQDEHPPEERDPVLPAERSAEATSKAQTRTLPDGQATHSFRTLLNSLRTIVQNDCKHDKTGVTFSMTTTPNKEQQHALDLLKSIKL